jgi:multimeric flavodoxin WrbA
MEMKEGLMGKAVIFDGFPDAGGDLFVRLAEEELRGKGWDPSTVVLRERRLAPCVGCFDCWLATPGVCRQKDEGPDISRLYQAADVILILTPVTFGGYSSAAKRLLDRMLPTLLPFFHVVHGEVHHELRYRRNPVWLTVGVLPAAGREEAEELFRRLFRRNALNNQGQSMAMASVAAGIAPGDFRGVMGSLIEEVS